MKTSYTIADPTGNITALVTSPVPPARRQDAVRALLRGPVEQVGFILPPERGGAARLEMMGGEFCGNASMSLAAYLCAQKGLAAFETALEVSGAAGQVACTAARTADDVYRGSVEMPLPLEMRMQLLPGLDAPVPVVFFPGIAHVLLPGRTQAPAERMADWCARLGADALGVLPLFGTPLRIEPVVWVPAAHSLVHEHGCGSGTAAVGAWLCREQGAPVCAAIYQPGGVITVQAEETSIRISGTVRLSQKAQLELA